MNWHNTNVAPEGTHHLLKGNPLYTERFDAVLKFREPGLAPVFKRNAAWHIRPDGSSAYHRRFVRTFGFYEKLAAVIAEDGWHHIKPDGTDLYQARYAWCGNFQCGRCAVRDRDGTYFHLLTDGVPAYEPRWHYAGDFYDDIAVVQADDGRSTHIDLNGQIIHNHWFLDLDVFHKGFARARDENGCSHVNWKGLAAYSRRFAMVEPFYNGQARVENFDGSLEIIDEAGRSITTLRPAPASPPGSAA